MVMATKHPVAVAKKRNLTTVDLLFTVCGFAAFGHGPKIIARQAAEKTGKAAVCSNRTALRELRPKLPDRNAARDGPRPKIHFFWINFWFAGAVKV